MNFLRYCCGLSLALLVGVYLYVGSAQAQMPGTLDTSFLSGHIQSLANGPIYSIVLQSDGKIVIGGSFTSYNGMPISGIARLNIDGTVDTSWNSGLSGVNDFVKHIALQSDGKIIIAGDFEYYNGISSKNIARLNVNGILDISRDPTLGDGYYSSIPSIEVQSDDKVLIAGNFISYSQGRNPIIRLNANGTLDTSRNSSGSSADTMVLQSDGKVLIGQSINFNVVTNNYIDRLNSDGSIDASRNSGLSGADFYVNAIAVQSDGKIVIGGRFTTYNGISVNNIARLNTDGTFDISWNPGGSAVDSSPGITIISHIVILSDGKIMIGGFFRSYNGNSRGSLAKLNTDGTLDVSWNLSAPVNNRNNGNIDIMVILPDNKMIIGGDFVTYGVDDGFSFKYIAKININGTVDMTWGPGLSASNNAIHAVTELSNGKIIIGGSFTSYDRNLINSIARLNIDGTLDTSWNPSGSGANGPITTIALQSNGKIMIGGFFTSYNGTPVNRIARLNIDGTLDTSWNPGGSAANSRINSIVTQSDDKVLIAGNFRNYNGTSINRIARLNIDGTLDTSWNPGGSAANGVVNKIILLPDGKVLIGGLFSNYNGSLGSVARLNTNGTFDSSWTGAIFANNTIFAIAPVSNGKTLVGGAFTTYGGVARDNLARLNPNGTIDTSWNIGTYRPNDIAVLSNGDILIGGGGLVKFYSDEVVDTSWNSGSLNTLFGIYNNNPNTVRVIKPLSNGKILIGGEFISYNDISRFRIARLHGDLVTCLGNIGIINIVSLGVCLQSAGQSPQTPVVDTTTNSNMTGTTITTLGRAYRLSWRAAPLSTSSSQGSVRYVGVPITVPAITGSASQVTGSVYIVPFKSIEVQTGGIINPLY